MIRVKQAFTYAGLAASLAFLSGCFDDDKGPTAGDKQGSQTATTNATKRLGTAVESMSDYQQFEYGKEDLTDLKAANGDFRKAVQLDPANKQARLGSAITGVLLAAQSQRLSSVINQTLEAKSPFDASLVEGAPLARAGVMRKVAAAAEFPEFHEIQDAIADTLLPALDEAIVNLRSVAADPAFSMTLTVDGEVIELDHAEASVLLAGFLATKGLVTMFLSYDIDLDIDGSYDYLEEISGVGDVEDFSQLTAAQKAAFNQLATILKPGSAFLAVRPAWKARLAEVDDHIKEALSIVKEGVSSIRNETDNQADDLLRVCSPSVEFDCIKSAELDEGLAAIDTGLKYLSQPYTFEIPDLDTAISVNFAAYFNVQDYKKLYPYYGFYDANDWSDEKPVLYFSDAAGNITGNIKTLQDLGDRAELEGLTAREVVLELKTIIRFQDPTFQGFLPGATEAGLWNLILKAADKEDAQVPVAKRAVSYMSPRFALSFLGKR